MFKAFIAALLVGLTSLVTSAVAGVYYNPEDKAIRITGKTTSYQYKYLNDMLAIKDVRRVYMSGPGGELYAGLAIGRLLHRRGLSVTIPEDTICASACALAAMGSPTLYVDGKLYVHRGYLMMLPAMATPDEFARRSGLGYMDTARYLIEMGYTLHLNKVIIQNSNPCVFLDMGGKSFIDQLRTDDPLSVRENYNMGKVDVCV